MKVGVMLSQAPEDGAGGTWQEIRAMAHLAEDGGADSVWVCDHFMYQPSDRPRIGYHEAWTLVSALAAATERVQIGTLVLATSFRPPGLLAKMAATADDVAAGRLILGIGCGWYELEYQAFGYPFDHRVGRFEEAAEIVVRLLRDGDVSFEGRWYTLDDAIVLPKPAHRTPILIAAGKPRMMQITARFADAWQTAWFGRPNDAYLDERRQFEDACQAEGRDPSTVELTVGVNCGASDDEAKSLRLDASAIADGLGEWAALGIGHVMLGVEPTTPAGYEIALEGVRRFRAGQSG
jgi:alkanesulfonate monooxygenase SsuD/methylene tetrahydromethanopterin reductase-like flavin-dependent oxidoreductase (luciferase family)